jgi:S-adenosylhomocysteine hydrolase
LSSLLNKIYINGEGTFDLQFYCGRFLSHNMHLVMSIIANKGHTSERYQKNIRKMIESTKWAGISTLEINDGEDANRIQEANTG